ncbi:Transmembrane protease serine 3 [Paragonimus heterotremus]|uniref:Transmembrane protease serine 3 n=1 Tax=Paragonimus heterotremus TaxID=100268 RepID=A0A8J4TFZ3_9TREM|nr:Transmembrane protease serine 3 [Paragonimus heterotremus]
MKTRYWESILKHFEKEVSTDRFALRPHCGRNRYDGGYTRWFPQSVHKRIVGGEESRVAEWPWLVSLQLKALDTEVRWVEGFEHPFKRFPGAMDELKKMSVDQLKAAIAQLRMRLKEYAPDQLAELDIDEHSEQEMTRKEGHMCGGALISPYWILSAKHCFQKKHEPALSLDPNRWIAVLGEHHLKEPERHQTEYEIAKIIIYPDEPEEVNDPSILLNDIALIKLARPAVLDEFVQIACLPYPEEAFREDQLCSVAGWGLTEDEGVMSFIPQHVHIPLVPNSQCKSIYDTAPTSAVNITPSVLCAGDRNGKDSCQYDSGGPLLCRSAVDNQRVITGIVSYGLRCASAYPGIYTRVPHYIDWIRNIINNN